MSKAQLMSVFLVLMLLLLVTPVAQVGAATPYQTIPTRTPTPGVTPTTPPSGGGNPTATNEPPPPASTTGPTATQSAEGTTTATATLPVSAPSSSTEEQFATAQPCGMEPTLQATTGRTKLRSGPGQDYEDIGSLEFLEVRPIIGRAANAPWWQTTLADGTPGWIADALVTVQGFTGAVPLVSSPALPSGVTPTAGPAWNPTPNPACTPSPISALTNTPDPTRQPTATRLPETSTLPASTATSSVAPDETVTVAPNVNAGGAGPQVTATAVPPPTSALVAAGNPAAQIPTAIPLEADTQAAASAVPVDWLPMVGVGLIIAGVVVYFVRRR